jgi:hypothetical protein
MKRIFVFTIIAMFCFGGEVIKTYNFSPGDIEIKSVQGYDYLTLKGCDNYQDPGKPCLPYKSLKFVIPASAIVTDVKVIGSSETWLEGSYLILPGQKPVPVSYPSIREFTEPDKSLYDSNEPYPKELLEKLPVGNMNGFRIAQMQIFPFEYLPKDRKIKLYESITISVSYKKGEYSVVPKSEAQIKNFGKVVKSLVENPEDVDRFTPTDRKSMPYLINTPYPIEDVKIKGKTKQMRQSEIQTPIEENRTEIRKVGEKLIEKPKREGIKNTTSNSVIHKSWLEAPHPEIPQKAEPEAVVNAYISSPHPYANNMDQSYYVYGPPENTWMCIHFSQINTESGYDYVYVYDDDGTLLNIYSGSYGSTYTDWGDGPTFRVRFVSDVSNTDYGFDVDYIQVGGSCSYENTQHPYLPNTDELVDMYGPADDWIGELCFYYDSIHTESNYDYVYCYDKDNSTVLNTWSGQYDNQWSDWSTYNYSYTTQPHERSRLTSDVSIQYYGWLVDYYNFFRNHRVESAHYYPNSANQTYYVYGPQDQGSIQMRVHFAKLYTESGYDYVKLYDATGNLINSYSGNEGTNFWSDWGQGNYIRVVLTSDGSIPKWGFAIDQYEWQAVGEPNLTYYTPSGWDYPIVPSSVAGTHTVGPDLQGGATTYTDWAIINNGDATAKPTFYTYLYSDGVPLQGWYTDSLMPDYYAYVEDWTYTFTAGDHTLMTFVDSTDVVAESNENDNKYSRTFTWGGGGTPGWDHVIITNNSLKPSWNNFRSFIRSTYGLADTVITTEYIYSNYSGTDNQEKIRNFIIDAVNNHSTQYILLGGDINIVPYRKTFSGYISGSPAWNDTIPCDLYYMDLDGNWDGNNNGTYGEPADNIDMYPDVWLGRATVGSSTDITRFTNRFQDYYNTTSHEQNILLAGFDADATTQGETTMELYSNLLPASYIKKKVYDSHAGNHKDTVRIALNNGQNIAFHIDHGQWNYLGCGDYNHGWGMSNSDMDGLTNQPEYTVFTSVACLIGAFDQSDCIMEHFMNAASGGAVCCMTNSRFGWFVSGENPQTSYSAAYMRKFFDRLFAHSPASGTDFLLGKADLIATANSNNLYRWSMYALNLFGDPIQTIHIPFIVGIEEEEVVDVKTKNTKFEIYPNPFSKSTVISYSSSVINDQLPVTNDLQCPALRIYDATGRVIKTFNLASCLLLPVSAVSWDGTDQLNRPVPVGVYFVRLTTPGQKYTEKVILLR